jgi:hypothetical protein
VIPRAEMLAELMRLRFGIAIAGAHGKTSTTSMIALVLERRGLDPTAVIGGRLSVFGSNARLGQGEYMVVEADESDRSFLKLSPSIAVMTNIDREHMEAYGSFADLEQAFVDFANKVPFYGAVVACADDRPLARILPRLTRRVITYGIEASDATIEPLMLPSRDSGRRARSCGGPNRPPRPSVRSRSRSPAAIRCRTRWPRSRSASSSTCRSRGLRKHSHSSRAPSAASSSAESLAASPWSTTTVITRPSSPP